MSIGVILPAHNVAPHLTALLGELRGRHPDFQLLVVDDGSQDATAEMARRGGAEVASHDVNRGKGAALLTGYRWALARGLEWVYTMDADGQHLPADMKPLLVAARQHGYDIVVGTRMGDPVGMPWLRRLVNRLTSWVVSRLAGCSIPDSQSGFRLFRTRCLTDLRLCSVRYDAESEILVRLAWRGARIGTVDITSVYAGQHSSIRPWRDTVRFLRLAFRLWRERRTGRGGTIR
jgi:glycosyltransferase involved in cell wall biosynthesis